MMLYLSSGNVESIIKKIIKQFVKKFKIIK